MVGSWMRSIQLQMKWEGSAKISVQDSKYRQWIPKVKEKFDLYLDGP